MNGRIQLSRCHETVIFTCLMLVLFTVIPGCNIGGSFKGFDGISPGGSSSNPSQTISLSSTELDFGSVPSGSVKTQPISISNHGSEDLLLNDLYLENSSEFSLNIGQGVTISNNQPYIVSPGQSVMIELQFQPSTTGYYATILHIYCNDPGSSNIDIHLYGNGVDISVPSSDVTLSWVAPSTNADGSPLTDLSGFKIYYGNAPGNYTQSIDTGISTTYTFKGLAPGSWYFSVTAYDDSGNESSFSTEVSTNI